MQLSELFLEKSALLNEVVEIPSDIELDDAIRMLEAAKRGLGLANRIKNPQERKKHVRAVFVNLNKIRGALAKFLEKVE